jgi:hypothetical protein
MDDFGAEVLVVLFIAVIFFLGLVVGCIMSGTLEIQEIKQADNGYYVTINNEIYYKEVEN